jgi:GNAT superfamily N-acetyltransferase
MNIVDISPETEKLYYCCLEDWSDEMKEAGDHKQRWYEKMKDKGVRVKFAQDDNGALGGMIQYMPIEHSIFEGRGLYVVLCIWVHGYKEGRGNFRKKGMGSALLKAVEEDCQKLGADGLVTWGLIIPTFMRASWFRKKGYKTVDKSGIIRLLWKPFNQKAVPPKMIKPRKQPEKRKDKVTITVFKNGWCPAMNLVYERACRAAKAYEEKVEFREFETTNREIMYEWGINDGLYIQGKAVRTGPPPSYEKIRKKVARSVKKIK